MTYQTFNSGNLIVEVPYVQSAKIDPLGPMILFESPCPDVARAVVGPFPTTNDNQVDEPVWCLAVHGETFAARIAVKVAQLQSDPKTFWETVAAELARTKNQALPTINSSARLSPPDCVTVLSNMASWCPRPNQWTLHPTVRAVSQAISLEKFGTVENHRFEDKLWADLQAQTAVERAIKSGVSWVLQALNPELLNVLIRRPRMGICMVHKICSSAATHHGQQAVAYAVQAIATESLGALDLIARGQLLAVL